MKGQDEVARARLSGRRATIVSITLADKPTLPEGCGINRLGQGFVLVEHDDVPARLDLRCVAGLPVIVLGHGDKRWLDVVMRAATFKPASIVGGPGDCWVVWTEATGLMDLP